MTVTLCHKQWETETGPGGETMLRSHMPHHVLSFLLVVKGLASSSSWPNSVTTPIALHPIHHPHPAPVARNANATVTVLAYCADPYMIDNIIAHMTSLLSILMSFTLPPTS